jgi:hypothetical protein
VYKELKHLLVSEPIVDFPYKVRSYSLIVDSATGNDVNDGGLGDILTQTDRQGKEWKDERPQPTLLSPLPQCTAPNQQVLNDLFGPIKTSDKGKKMVRYMTDAFTKYVELVALTYKEAETTGEAIFNRRICRYGTPLEIMSENGKEFRNILVAKLYKRLDIEHTTTAAYYPQCNLQAEVCNKTIAKYLNSFVDETFLDWEQYLAPMAFSYNTSLHCSIQATPYFLTYGQSCKVAIIPKPRHSVLFG